MLGDLFLCWMRRNSSSVSQEARHAHVFGRTGEQMRRYAILRSRRHWWSWWVDLISHRAYDAALRVSHGRARVGFHRQALSSRCLARHVLVERVLMRVDREEVGRCDAGVACWALRRALVVGIVARAVELNSDLVSLREKNCIQTESWWH